MIAVVAAACVRPATVGTATCAGPVEMSSATALPGATSVPAAGFELMTLPAGTVALLAWVIAPTVNPAPVIAAVRRRLRRVHHVRDRHLRAAPSR